MSMSVCKIHDIAYEGEIGCHKCLEAKNKAASQGNDPSKPKPTPVATGGK